MPVSVRGNELWPKTLGEVFLNEYSISEPHVGRPVAGTRRKERWNRKPTQAAFLLLVPLQTTQNLALQKADTLTC